MRFTRNPAKPSTTDNHEAKALIFRAQSRCEGCRMKWRLDLRRGSGFMHKLKRREIECTAQRERQALRDIAAAARGK